MRSACALPSRTGRRAFLLGLGAAMLACRPRAEPGHADGLVLFVPPFHGLYETARRLNPFAEWMQWELARPVRVASARDFRAFVRRLRRADCDLALVPAHLAAPLVREGWRPVFDIVCDREILLFGRIDADIEGVEAIRRLRLVLPDPVSLVSLAALAHLRERHLEPAKVVHVLGLANVITAVERGMAEMGAVPRLFYQREEAEEEEGEQVCREIATFPFELRKALLADPSLPRGDVERLRRKALGGRPSWLDSLGIAVELSSTDIYYQMHREFSTDIEKFFRNSRDYRS